MSAATRSTRRARAAVAGAAVAVACLAGAPAAHAHSAAEAEVEQELAKRIPERPAAVARGSAELRAAGDVGPAADYGSATLPPASPSAPADGLRAGVGRADMTPPMMGKYFLGGWTRADRIGHGVSLRLTISALTLQRGSEKVALVALAGFAVPQGLQQAVARRVADLGFTERNVIISATHTHSSVGGYSNSETLNTAAPGVEMILQNPTSVAGLVSPAPADRQLYTFLVERAALAIRRSAARTLPAVAGWGHTTLYGLTRNRSLPARLADFGTNDPAKVPYEKTINPNVDVLRVDALTAPTCAGQVRRAQRRATSARKRARTLARRRDRARTALRRASASQRRAALRRYATAKRRARTAARTATKRRRSARAWAARACARDGRQPLGAWTSFANHGTVVKSEFGRYSADHGGVAALQLEARIRDDAQVPAGQALVAVYGSADQGDQSAGLEHNGPAGADLVGRTEGDAMFRAWKRAEATLTPRPTLGRKWMRFCFCGRGTSDGGRVADKPVIGAPFLTGSEEGRGPLFDAARLMLEGLRLPALDPVQGGKVQVPIGSWSEAWPMALLQIGDGGIVTIPGEPTMGVGERLRAAVLEAAKGAGVKRAVVAGLVNDYLNYVTTPEEYDTQQYEGASTVFGRHEGTFFVDRARELGRALSGAPIALEQRDYDASNGVRPDGPPYGTGAASGTIVSQPGSVRRLGHATLVWKGGADGADLPVDRAFLTAERRVDGRWVAVDNDLGVSFVWKVDGSGRYEATWEPPVNAPTGTYRLVVSASRYRLASASFAVLASRALEARSASARHGRARVQVGFPLPRLNVDLTARPTLLQRGTVTFRVGGRDVAAPIGRDGIASVAAPAGSTVEIPAGAIRDADGNVNDRAFTVRAGE